jgi:hypothetical protein
VIEKLVGIFAESFGVFKKLFGVFAKFSGCLHMNEESSRKAGEGEREKFGTVIYDAGASPGNV